MRNKSKKVPEFTARKVIEEETGKELTRIEFKEGIPLMDFFKIVNDVHKQQEKKDVDKSSVRR